jgi:2-polyprenyl-6-methoxyphenol hydroxylase-like FAD-dependent oxidoreductase
MIDFWGCGYTVAERMGVLPQVLEAGYAIEGVRFVDRRGRAAGGFSTKILRTMMAGEFTSLPRGDLAAAAYQTVKGRVETLFDTSIAAIDDHGDGVRLGFASGLDREFDLVVGADGQHSAVRGLVFGPEPQFERQLGYFVAAFDAEGYRTRDERAYVSYGVPGRQVTRIAVRGDRTMFLFVFSAAHMTDQEPRNLDERKAVLHRCFDDAGWECRQILRALDDVQDLYFDRVSQIVMDRWSKGRVALVGDAAACVSLLAGEGTGLAMTEAYVLAGELDRARGDHQEAFRNYEQRLRPLIEDKQRSARNFAAAFVPKSAFGLWARNQATRLMVIPIVAKLLMGSDLGDDIELPDYAM